jgi:ABC-type polysaccharide/polyol phosphate export permease
VPSAESITAGLVGAQHVGVRLPSRTALAVEDLAEGLRRSWLWARLAQQDIKLRYRGSLIGPFWQTLTTAVMVAGMGVIYSHLFRTQLEDYLPMLTIGLIVWTFLTSLVTEGCNTFITVQGIIQQMKLPYSLHAYRLVFRNLLVLAHNVIIIPIVMILFPHHMLWSEVALIPLAIALVALNGVWISVVLGMLSARFHDVPPIVSSVLQLLFFVTPVMWSIDALGGKAAWARLNPFYAAIDVIRSPLLGVQVQSTSWPILLGLTVIGSAAGFVLFARLRHRIAFWV